jgi:hypothetical protein
MGATGAQGPAGTNGTNVQTSPGSPGTGSCTNGDTDVDLTDGEVYTCTVTGWSDTGSSIEGPAGPAGAGATVSQLSSGDTNCPDGGASITDGGGNTAYACNGANGSSSGPLGQDAASVYGTGTLTVPAAFTGESTLIPGLALTMTVPANSLVYISSDGGATTTSEASNGWSDTDIGLFMDDVALPGGNEEELTMLDNDNAIASSRWSLSTTLQFPTGGTHTFEVAAAGGGGGSSAIVSGSNGNLDQGTLSVLILRE